MNVVEALRGRRTIHTFRPEPVPETVILEALESARWAPNHRTTEPWHFYLLGPDAAARISHLNYELVLAEKGENAARAKLQRWLAQPGWLVITCDRSDSEIRQQEDYAACCCAAHNAMLHLWAHGVGTKWGTGRVTRTDEFCRIIGADHELELVVGLFWYGYPAAIPGGHRSKRVEATLARLP
jgi:nitroreductase